MNWLSPGARRDLAGSSEEQEPLGILLLPGRLEEIAMEGHARDLLSIPRVVALEPPRVRLPGFLRATPSPRQAKRLKFPGAARLLVLYDPEQYPLARALLARHEDAELWYIPPAADGQDAAGGPVPTPVEGPAPNPADGSVPNPADGSVSNPADGSVSNPADRPVPDPADRSPAGSAPEPAAGSANDMLSEFDDLARERATRVLTAADDGSVDDAALRDRLRELGVISPYAFAPGARTRR